MDAQDPAPVRPPTRRERIRMSTTEDIKRVALTHLTEAGSPDDLSLRSVARDLDLVPSALYRYFDSRESLLEALAGDACQSLASALARCAGRLHLDDPVDRGVRLARTYRRWCLDHAAEFQLLFSGALPPGGEDDGGSPAPARLLPVFRVPVEVLADQFARGQVPRPMTDANRVRCSAGELVADATATDLPGSLLQRLVLVWTTVHGFVSLELVGEAERIFDDTDAAFDELASVAVTGLYRAG